MIVTVKDILAVIISLLSFSSIAENKELSIASDPWCPFSCGKETDKKEGISIELVRAAFEPLGYKVNYINMTWIRSLSELKKGEVDMVSAVDDTCDPTTFISGKESVFPTHFAIFSRSNSNFTYDEKDINSLKGLTIGVNGAHSLRGLLSGAIGEFINKNLDNKDIVKKVLGEDAHIQLIKMLSSGRIDIFLDTAQVAQYYINQAKLQDKIKMSIPVSKRKIDEFIGFSPALPRSKELVQELKKDGTYTKIMNSYGVSVD